MKESLWGYWLLVLGIFVIIVLLLIQSLTTQNTHDYYAVKEITESSLRDSIDFEYYKEYGEVRISKETFIESFVTRFANTASLNNTYTIKFYEIYEVPPKVSLQVSSKSNSFNVVGKTESFDINNKLSMVVETSPEFTKGFDIDNEPSDPKCIDCIIIKRVGGNVVVTEGSTEHIPGEYSRTIVDDSFSNTECLNLVATFTKGKADYIGYGSFACRIPAGSKSKSCEVVMPTIIKTGDTQSYWVKKGTSSPTYIPGQKVSITGNTTFEVASQ